MVIVDHAVLEFDDRNPLALTRLDERILSVRDDQDDDLGVDSIQQSFVQRKRCVPDVECLSSFRDDLDLEASSDLRFGLSEPLDDMVEK